MNKTVDVVIPTFHPDEKLCTLLKSLLEQKYPVGHILIMNTQQEFWDSKIEDCRRKLSWNTLKNPGLITAAHAIRRC